MGKQDYTVEQIIVKLREAELHCRAGKTIREAGQAHRGKWANLLLLAQKVWRYGYRWVDYYNTVSQHSSLGGETSAPQSYTFDDLEMTAAMRQSIRSVISVMLVSEEKKKLAGMVI